MCALNMEVWQQNSYKIDAITILCLLIYGVKCLHTWIISGCFRDPFSLSYSSQAALPSTLYILYKTCLLHWARLVAFRLFESSSISKQTKTFKDHLTNKLLTMRKIIENLTSVCVMYRETFTVWGWNISDTQVEWKCVACTCYKFNIFKQKYMNLGVNLQRFQFVLIL